MNGFSHNSEMERRLKASEVNGGRGKGKRQKHQLLARQRDYTLSIVDT